MKKSLIFNLLPVLFTAMATFSFFSCGSDGDDEGIPGIGGDTTTPATIIGKWKLMTIDNAGNPTGTWEIYCFNADGTAYSQELDANGNPIDKHNYTYTFENGTICTYKENGRLQDMLLNVVVTATTLTATSPDGFTATMIRVYDDDNNTDSGNDDNSDNGNDDNTTVTPGTPSVTAGIAIDLGLSVKWASCNVGATAPEEYGDYYAWGGILENGSSAQNKYNNGAMTLALADDVAHVKWGGAWRMPTLNEQKELLTNCTFTRTSLNGVNGYRVTGPNGNSIFMPATGGYTYDPRYGSKLTEQGSVGFYWSSSRSSYSGYSYYLILNSGNYTTNNFWGECRYPVRPVCK